jgi:hypothetical protein
MLVKWEAQALFFFTHKFSSNFDPKKYDFNLCKRIFFMEKMAQIIQISKKKTKSTIFNDKFYRFSQEYRRIFFFLILFSFVKCCQIWLSYFLDDRHFDEVQNP